MKVIDKLLTDNKILVSDGAWGTFLHQKGLKPGDCPELWNITHREDVLDIAKSYIQAGSDIILTNSFGGSPSKLKHYGLEEKTYELNKAAAQISREAAGNDHYVFGSIGPTGVLLMMGEVSKETLLKGFMLQADALVNGGSDAICIETMTDIDEALTAIQAVKKVSDVDIACTFTFERMHDGQFKTIMGNSVETVVNSLVEENVSMIGTNCGNGFQNMISLVKQIREVEKDIPILVHANAGMPVLINNETKFPETPEQMAEKVFDLIDSGANIIGGCCGTTPNHIKAIANRVNEYNAG